MGIEIKIKQPESNIDIYRIEELWKNACTNAFEGETNPRIGVQDEFYRMQLQFINTSKEYDEKKSQSFDTANVFILFDKNNYGSGIQLWFEDDNICMWTSFPTTYSEIVSLYKLVNIICNESGIKEFYRGSVGEFELVDISQLNWFIELGINDTLLMLDRMKKNILEDDASDGNISINGVVNPLSITLENLQEWGIDLPLEGNMENITIVMKNYETFMNEIQQRDLFYAVFKLYQIKKDEETVINGYISVATDCDTILPIEPEGEFYFVANRYDTSKINKFYATVENSEGKLVEIEYEEFLKKIDFEKREKYDGKHFIVILSPDDIDELINK